MTTLELHVLLQRCSKLDETYSGIIARPTGSPTFTCSILVQDRSAYFSTCTTVQVYIHTRNHFHYYDCTVHGSNVKPKPFPCSKQNHQQYITVSEKARLAPPIQTCSSISSNEQTPPRIIGFRRKMKWKTKLAEKGFQAWHQQPVSTPAPAATPSSVCDWSVCVVRALLVRRLSVKRMRRSINGKRAAAHHIISSPLCRIL
jgi:hypothetical protein